MEIADDLKRPELFINRELSLLEFNRRVLEQARDPDNPLLERLKFLCISSTNLDEFFEVRAAGLVQKAELGSVATGPDNMSPAEVVRAIAGIAPELVESQYRTLNDELIPALEAESIRFIRRSNWSTELEEWLHRYFEEELAPVISPLGLDPAHPFPRILNKSLNFIIELEGRDAFGRTGGIAVVQAPRALPRVIQLPSGLAGDGSHDFVFLSSIIHAFVAELFPGMRVRGCYQFRVTRNSDLFVDTEEVDDLLLAVEGELASRRYGDAVRLEVADNCTPEMIAYLREKFELPEDAVYQVNGPVNLNRLMAVYDLVERNDLKFPSFTPSLPKSLAHPDDLFEVMRQGEILLHHPFESFAPVVDFLRQAAADPHVLAIKQTLYRTGPDSAVVDALVKAARAGKEVTVVVELRARFDEKENIALANRLQEAGAHVVYGVVGYKTHAKMILVIRRETRGLRYYVHLGTGNYHARTARLYTDYGLLTADQKTGDDVHNIFLQLTSLGRVPKLKRLLQSPFTLHETLMAGIEREIENAGAGRPARIVMKVNSLVEPSIIQGLYSASRAGVRIQLVVRGMCSLRPGLEGVSENIEVRSIIGRFLEHTRIYYFENGGKPRVYGSSADCMERNLFRRVEVAFPLETDALRQRVIDELETYLADNTQAWLLGAEGEYSRARIEEGMEPVVAQRVLLERLAESC
ncbi:MAG: polyphosphate kinase 1 [Pseudomonadota bacterium]